MKGKQFLAAMLLATCVFSATSCLYVTAGPTLLLGRLWRVNGAGPNLLACSNRGALETWGKCCILREQNCPLYQKVDFLKG